MYFWRIQLLKDELSEGTLSQSARFKYYLACTIIGSIFLELTVLFPIEFSTVLVASSIFTICATVAGTTYCYLVNRNRDNKEFIDRFICIGWVVGIRLLVICLPLYLLYFIVGGAVGGEDFAQFHETFNSVNLAFCVLFTIIAYWLIGHHMADVASRQPSSENI